MKKVAVFTSTRAEYGLLKPIILAIEKHPDLLVQLIVAGTHLSEAHGNTVSEIIDDGVEIAAKINVPFSGKSNEETVESLSQLIKCMPKIFFELKPDLIILLGDRFELLGVANAAVLYNVPILHIHGGETTEGAIDDLIRHSLTKLSNFHFVAAEPYKKELFKWVRRQIMYGILVPQDCLI